MKIVIEVTSSQYALLLSAVNEKLLQYVKIMNFGECDNFVTNSKLIEAYKNLLTTLQSFSKSKVIKRFTNKYEHGTVVIEKYSNSWAVKVTMVTGDTINLNFASHYKKPKIVEIAWRMYVSMKNELKLV